MTPNNTKLVERLTTAELRVLSELYDCAEGGSFAQACDGSRRTPATKLMTKGLAEWHGVNWGSYFYSITDAGRAALERARA